MHISPARSAPRHSRVRQRIDPRTVKRDLRITVSVPGVLPDPLFDRCGERRRPHRENPRANAVEFTLSSYALSMIVAIFTRGAFNPRLLPAHFEPENALHALQQPIRLTLDLSTGQKAMCSRGAIVLGHDLALGGDYIGLGFDNAGAAMVVKNGFSCSPSESRSSVRGPSLLGKLTASMGSKVLIPYKRPAFGIFWRHDGIPWRGAARGHHAAVVPSGAAEENGEGDCTS